MQLTQFADLFTVQTVARSTFEAWSALFTEQVDGREQSVFSDAWAAAAQRVTLPHTAVALWQVAPEVRAELVEQLRSECGAYSVRLTVEMLRAAPSVGAKSCCEAGREDGDREVREAAAAGAVRISWSVETAA